MNINVFIDTSVIINESFLRSMTAQAFFKACVLLEIGVIIPEIVIDEAKGKYKDKLKEKLVTHKKSYKELSKIVDLEELDISITDKDEEYKDWLNELIEDNGIIVATYPNIPFKELVEKSYEKNKPFKSTGVGHKDYIIWKTIKEYIESQNSTLTNYFLTNNSEDFCTKIDGGELTLHSELAIQITEETRKPEVYSSIKSLFDTKLAPLFEGITLSDIPDLELDDVNNIARETLQDELYQYSAYGFEGMSFGNDVTVDMVHTIDVDNIQLTKVNDDVVINVIGHLLMEVDGYIDKSDYCLALEQRTTDIHVVDPDWNNRVMAVSTTVRTAFELTLFYSIDSKSIIGHTVTLPQEIEDEWPYK